VCELEQERREGRETRRVILYYGPDAKVTWVMTLITFEDVGTPSPVRTPKADRGNRACIFSIIM
jgi:hypothetical protein